MTCLIYDSPVNLAHTGQAHCMFMDLSYNSPAELGTHGAYSLTVLRLTSEPWHTQWTSAMHIHELSYGSPVKLGTHWAYSWTALRFTGDPWHTLDKRKIYSWIVLRLTSEPWHTITGVGPVPVATGGAILAGVATTCQTVRRHQLTVWTCMKTHIMTDVTWHVPATRHEWSSCSSSPSTCHHHHYHQQVSIILTDCFLSIIIVIIIHHHNHHHYYHHNKISQGRCKTSNR